MRANRAGLNALADAGVVVLAKGARVRVKLPMGHGFGVEMLDGEHKGRKAWSMSWHIRIDGEEER